MIIADPVKVFKYGLEMASHSWPYDTLDKATKLHDKRFRQAYGVGPNTIVKVSSDLHSTKISGNLSIKDQSLNEILMALSWLNTYPKEHNHAGNWKCCENKARKVTWKYVKSIQGLKNHKVQWIVPDPNNPPEEVFLCTVDGVHCQISEIRTKPDKNLCSYKNKKPGVVYELAIAVYDSRLVRINGPFLAGTSDIDVFRKPNGLLSKIPKGKRVIADRGYSGEANICSIRNPMDSKDLKEMKNRALAKHEVFNGRLKDFGILDQRFQSNRDSLNKHKCVFEACCVLQQYDVEDGHPLFKV
jgi:hypothetical protein